MSALTTGRGASHAQSSLTSFLSRKRGSPFLKKGSPKALRAFPPVQNLRAKKRMFFSGSRKGSLLKRTAELWGFRLRFACQKPHISCVRRAVRGSAPKPRRLLKKAGENFHPASFFSAAAQRALKALCQAFSRESGGRKLSPRLVPLGGGATRNDPRGLTHPAERSF